MSGDAEDEEAVFEVRSRALARARWEAAQWLELERLRVPSNRAAEALAEKVLAITDRKIDELKAWVEERLADRPRRRRED